MLGLCSRMTASVRAGPRLRSLRTTANRGVTALIGAPPLQRASVSVLPDTCANLRDKPLRRLGRRLTARSSSVDEPNHGTHRPVRRERPLVGAQHLRVMRGSSRGDQRVVESAATHPGIDGLLKRPA